MSVNTTPRRPSCNPSISDLSSPPNSLARRASSTGSTLNDSPLATDRKKRNRTLLRDYYGLGPNKGDTHDLDSPETFNSTSYFNNLTSTASLPDLLRRETDLLNEIRELDGERQSLVYNHHHELIEASETIRKMKSRAEALDSSLDSLKTSFEKISQLSTSLAPPVPAPTSRSHSHSHSHPISTNTPTPTSPSQSNPSLLSTATNSTTFSPLLHLAPLLSLPILLKSLDKPNSDLLWGSWEPALTSWQEENVQGVEEISRECRQVLRNHNTGRRSSVSSTSYKVGASASTGGGGGGGMTSM
ncbi:hypothetical protein JCM5350_002421 [Sporobolomyces pararoseus]